MRKLKTLILSVFMSIASLSFAITQAQATPILIIDNGELLGANGVNVGGSFFDVRFAEGSCVDLFMGCNNSAEDFQFTTEASGRVAAQALLNQVFIDIGLNLFDTDPETIFGCSSTVNCTVLIPVGFFPGLLNNVIVSNSNGLGGSANSTLRIRRTDSVADNFSSGANRTFAIFTASTSISVPEPSAGLLMLAGFGILAASRFKKKARS